jgi:hypothetical protein
MGHAALLGRCELPLVNESSELTQGTLWLIQYSERPLGYASAITFIGKYGTKYIVFGFFGRHSKNTEGRRRRCLEGGGWVGGGCWGGCWGRDGEGEGVGGGGAVYFTVVDFDG